MQGVELAETAVRDVYILKTQCDARQTGATAHPYANIDHLTHTF